MNPGQKVTYIGNPHKGPEKGIVKSLSDSDYRFVVFNCDEDWENYVYYTGNRCKVDELVLGWINYMPLPKEIDEKVSTLFSMCNQFGYEAGYTVLCEVMDKEDALFLTFYYWLLNKGIKENGLLLEPNFIKLNEKTIPTSFGKDYKYKISITGKFMDQDFTGENEIQVGDYSRYKVGLGIYLDDAVECFVRATGRKLEDCILLESFQNKEA